MRTYTEWRVAQFSFRINFPRKNVFALSICSNTGCIQYVHAAMRTFGCRYTNEFQFLISLIMRRESRTYIRRRNTFHSRRVILFSLDNETDVVASARVNRWIKHDNWNSLRKIIADDGSAHPREIIRLEPRALAGLSGRDELDRRRRSWVFVLKFHKLLTYLNEDYFAGYRPLHFLGEVI